VRGIVVKKFLLCSVVVALVGEIISVSGLAYVLSNMDRVESSE
jgi:hypothetical protein